MKGPHAKATLAAMKEPASPPGFDTMAAVDMLTKADIGQRPASAIVEVVRDAQRELATEASLLSTKAALKAGLREEMAELKAELKTDMAELKTELKTEMAELKAELKTDVVELKVELKTDIKDLDTKIANQFSQLYRYLLVGGGVCVTSLAGILGVIMHL